MDTKTKTCTKCKEVKPLAEFSKDKSRKDGHNPPCKGCVKRYNKENSVAIAEQRRHYNEKNKVAKAEYNKRHYDKNKVAIAEKQKRHREKNKVAIAERQRRYNKKNKVAIAERDKRHYEENKVAILERQKRYNKKNKVAIAEREKRYNEKNKVARAERDKHRRATDPFFKLSHNIRSLIRGSFRNGGFNKKSKTAEILGCTFKEYYAHIESQFTDGMSWQRMDDIHIDHRLPLSAATTEAEILVLNHHRNLQPMWATDNLTKAGSYCPKDLAAYFKKHLPS